MELNRVKLFQVLKEYKLYTKNFTDFTAKYFGDEASCSKLWDFLISDSNKLYTKEKKDFYQKYACDLEWAKKLEACKTTSNSSQQNTGNQNQNINPNQGGGSSYQNTDISSQEVLKGEKTVKVNMKGDIVKTIQEYLKTNKDSNGNSYFNKNSTSYFGSVTKDAVIQFQKDKNLSREDGVVDKETMEALMNKKTKKDKVKFEPLDTEDADVWYESIKSKIIKENKEDLIKQKKIY